MGMGTYLSGAVGEVVAEEGQGLQVSVVRQGQAQGHQPVLAHVVVLHMGAYVCVGEGAVSNGVKPHRSCEDVNEYAISVRYRCNGYLEGEARQGAIGADDRGQAQGHQPVLAHVVVLHMVGCG